MIEKIGIDAGGSLIKIAYEEKGKLFSKTFPNQELDRVAQWISVIAPTATLSATGGKAGHLRNISTNTTYVIDEFEAVTAGTKFLLHREKRILNEDFILVNIGTGTSIFFVTDNSFERVLGSGIGGGTLMGLGHLITGKKSFAEFTSMAEKGNNRNSDLLVRDIYSPEEPPIPGDLTAANLGKAHLNKDASQNDHVASLMQLIGETIMLLAGQAAVTKQCKKIVFVGGAITNNTALKNVFSSFQGMMSYEAIFLEKGSHAGAVGALISS